MEQYTYYLLGGVIICFGTIIILIKKGMNLVNVLKAKEKSLQKYSQIIDIEKEATRLQGEAAKLKSNFETLRNRHSELEKIVCSLESEELMLEYGFYKSKYEFDSSEKYKNRLDEIRDRQKEMISSKNAATCSTNWAIGNSKTEGKKMIDRTLKMALNAYNVECDNLILKVKYSNIGAIRERMTGLKDRINKFLEPLHAQLNSAFHSLKLQELELVFEYNEKLQQEKEEQREIKEQMREEEKARLEIEAAQKKAEKEEQSYQKALEKVQKDLAKANDEEKEKLLAKIAELEGNLEEAHQNKERALSMAQQTRRGHVYIISNIGSFGENVYKIGMTRRLEPMDRVKELSDASVPFVFDVHAMIYSEDAPTLEKELHEQFDKHRTNRINIKKEFFNASLQDIEKFCSEKKLNIEFTKTAEASEFRQTLMLKHQEQEGNKPAKENFTCDDIDLNFAIEAA